MAKAEILAGVCGFATTVEASADEKDPYLIHLKIESDCPAVTKLAEQIPQVNAFQEFAFRGKPRILALAPETLSHPACPVPAGIIKAVEVAAGLALPKDVTIKISS